VTFFSPAISGEAKTLSVPAPFNSPINRPRFSGRTERALLGLGLEKTGVYLPRQGAQEYTEGESKAKVKIPAQEGGFGRSW